MGLGILKFMDWRKHLNITMVLLSMSLHTAVLLLLYVKFEPALVSPSTPPSSIVTEFAIFAPVLPGAKTGHTQPPVVQKIRQGNVQKTSEPSLVKNSSDAVSEDKPSDKRPGKMVPTELKSNEPQNIAVDKQNSTELNENSATAPLSKSAASYVEELYAFLEARKRYPRTAYRLRQSGHLKLRISIAADGRFHRIELLEPAQLATFNEAALSMLRSIGKFKPPPGDQAREFVIPIRYQWSASL